MTVITSETLISRIDQSTISVIQLACRPTVQSSRKLKYFLDLMDRYMVKLVLTTEEPQKPIPSPGKDKKKPQNKSPFTRRRDKQQAEHQRLARMSGITPANWSHNTNYYTAPSTETTPQPIRFAYQPVC